MTFEQFQATRRQVADIATETGIGFGDLNVPGYVYASDLHIISERGVFVAYWFGLAFENEKLLYVEMWLYDMAGSELGWDL